MRYLLFACILLSTFTHAQIEGMVRTARPQQYSQEDKDVSEFVVQYATKDPKSIPGKMGYTMLLIGKRYSKFLDQNKIGVDSLTKAYSTLPALNANELKQYFKFKTTFSKDILKDWQGNKVYVQQRVYNKYYQYEEMLPTSNWTLVDETRNLLGYPCKKAKLTFRGRNYTAWYAQGIPTTDGPYLFHGLTGLILDIADEENIFQFTAVAIEKKKMNIYLRNEPYIMKVSRSDFRKVERNYFENPAGFISMKAYDESGKELTIPINSKKFNPIELQ